MAKSKKRRFWTTATIIIFMASGVLFFSQTNTVRALFSDEHVVEILFRFWNEIASKSEAGIYYQDLIYKHSTELTRIFNDHPQHVETEFLQTIEIFIPGLEALVNGKGDTVQITEEQISSLKAELDWIYSLASPALREDIEKELQRFPLDNFIGMTMSEALDYVNSNWVLGTQIVPLATPTRMHTATATIPICLVGPNPDCLEKPTLVTNSNVLWAHYVHHGVYFEYPGDWQVQYSSRAQIDEFTFLRQPESSAGGNIRLLNLTFLDLQNAPIENWDQVLPSLLSQRGCSNAPWEIIHITGFQGFECLWTYSDLPDGTFIFFLYNENQRMAIDLKANVEDKYLLESSNDLNALNKIFPSIQHIIESIRILEP